MKKTIRILVIWFIIFAIDVICSYALGHPFFMFPFPGGDMLMFIGLGYVISIAYPLGTASDPSYYVLGVYPIVYIIINIIIIIVAYERANLRKPI